MFERKRYKIFSRLFCAAPAYFAISVLLTILPFATSAQSQVQEFQSSIQPNAAGPTRNVPFLTLRNLTGSQDPARVYGDERSTLKAGLCQLTEFDFGKLGPLADRAPAFVREEFLSVDQIRQQDPDSVVENLHKTTAGRSMALYVHGYNIGFEKGCRRAVLLQENAKLTERFLWFSWPSDGAIAYYTRDEADLYWSVPDLADTIIDLDAQFRNAAVDVIGHSLGARGVVLALYEVANRTPDIRLGDVVLLAPDMDFEIFQRFAARIVSIARSVTVYIADGDRPLAVSAQVHGYPRLGETGNDTSTLSGVEFIDLSKISGNSPSGHLYHIHSPLVGQDLDQLLNKDMPAADRPNLEQSGPNYWVMKMPDQEQND